MNISIDKNNARIINIYKSADKENSKVQNFFGIGGELKELGLKSNLFGSLDTSLKDSVLLFATEDSIDFPIKNKFEEPFGKYVDQFMGSALGDWTKAVQSVKSLFARGEKDQGKYINPWVRNAQAWVGTEPISLDLSFSFKIGQFDLWSAKEEVLKPIAALMIPALPRNIDSFSMKGPYPSTPELLIGALKETSTYIDENGNEVKDATKSLSSFLSTKIAGAVAKHTYDISIGNVLLLGNCTCVAGTYNFSSAMDTEGYPISGNVKLTMRGIIPPSLNVSNATGIKAATRFGPK